MWCKRLSVKCHKEMAVVAPESHAENGVFWSIFKGHAGGGLLEREVEGALRLAGGGFETDGRPLLIL